MGVYSEALSDLNVATVSMVLIVMTSCMIQHGSNIDDFGSVQNTTKTNEIFVYIFLQKSQLTSLLFISILLSSTTGTGFSPPCEQKWKQPIIKSGFRREC